MFGNGKALNIEDGQSYILHHQKDTSTNSGDPLLNRFILQRASGETPPQDFENFEEVMHFLLDELMGADNSNG